MIINKSNPTNKDLEVLEQNKPLEQTKDIDFSDIVVKKPWGYEYLLFENDDVAIWILHLKPFSKTSMHSHPNKDTSLICLSGEVICKTLEDEKFCKHLDGVYLGKKVFHQSINDTKNEVILMEIETPVNKFDLVRIKDDYGRKAKAYENSKNYVERRLTTIKSLEEKVQKFFDNTIVEIGFAKNKNEFLSMCKNKDDKMIITLLNRNIWSKLGQKVFNVGQVILYSNEILKNHKINDSFVYLILKRNQD